MDDLITSVRRWTPVGSLRWDLITILAVAVAVQVVFPDRADWAAHVTAGGALVVVADAALGRRLGPWAVALGAASVLVLAVVAELTLTGPFDPADVAFTVAGALLVTGGASVDGAKLTARGDVGRLAMGWGMALLAGAVYYRYGIRRGP